MFGREDKLENVRAALNVLGCDMNFFQSWKKKYEKMNKQQQAVRERYDNARSMTQRAEADAGRLENMLQQAEAVDKKEAAGLLKDMKQMQNRFDHEFLISGEDREFHSIYDTILRLGVKAMANEEQRLIFQSEVENLLALLKENLAKEKPDMQQLSFFYLTGTDRELAQLPPVERTRRIAEKFEEELREPMHRLLTDAVERADEKCRTLEGMEDRRSRKVLEAIQILRPDEAGTATAEMRAQKLLEQILQEGSEERLY